MLVCMLTWVCVCFLMFHTWFATAQGYYIYKVMYICFICNHTLLQWQRDISTSTIIIPVPCINANHCMPAIIIQVSASELKL